MNMLEIALDYVAGGAPVLPLHTPDPAMPGGCSCRRRDCGEHAGKHPRTLSGVKDATNDPDTIRRWWGMWENANIGICPADGLVVVDIDPRHGGAAEFVALQDRHAQLPETRTAATGGGGWHLWFRHYGPTVGSIAPGIDVKSSNGYVVAPPSIHLSGKRYEWTKPIDIADAPDWLATLLTPPPVKRRPGTRTGITAKQMTALVRIVADAPKGSRNSRLYWASCRAHELGADVGPLVDAAVGVGLSRRAAEATANSAACAPPRKGVAS